MFVYGGFNKSIGFILIMKIMFGSLRLFLSLSFENDEDFFVTYGSCWGNACANCFFARGKHSWLTALVSSALCSKFGSKVLIQQISINEMCNIKKCFSDSFKLGWSRDDILKYNNRFASFSSFWFRMLQSMTRHCVEIGLFWSVVTQKAFMRLHKRKNFYL